MLPSKIMIVDDNKEFVEELKETLGLCGYDALGVFDSRQVLTMAQRIKPELILLDLRMPGTNGFELARELKNTRETAEIPIVAMSGYFPVDDRRLLLDTSAMEACVKKPFAISDLIHEIEAVLNKAERRRGAPILH